MSFVEWIVDGILSWISNWEYLAILFLMALESACMPVPSEIVMPFSGYLVWTGETGMTFWGIVLVGSLGCSLGSVVAYVAGYYGGRAVIIRYGKYFLISEKHLIQAENWFERWGSLATFIARLLPVIRTVISLPAGIAKMNFPKFLLYSFVGSLPWNAMLAYVGYALGPSWQDIEGIWKYLDYLVVAAIVIVAVYYGMRLYKQRKSTDKLQEPTVKQDTVPEQKNGQA